MSAQSSGMVKWYNPEKAYGFITDVAGQDIFVHRNAIVDGRPWLVDGQGVAFAVKQGMKGLEATDVRVVQDVDEIPAARQRAYANDRGHASGYGGASEGGYGGGYRNATSRPPRETDGGLLPSGPVTAEVMRVDPNGRFLFAHAESVGDDVYVHGSLFAQFSPQQGDEIMITIERSHRGLRARTVTLR